MLDDVEDIVDGDDALEAPVLVDDRDRPQALLPKEAGNRLLVLVLRDRHELCPHDVADLLLWRGGEELTEGGDPQQALLRIEDVDVVEGLDLRTGLLAEVADRLVDGHVRPDAGVPRVHPAAGPVLGVGEESVDLLPRLVVEEGEERFALRGGCRLHQVRRVVRGQEAHPGPALRGRQGEQELGLVAVREPEEELLSLRPREKAESLQTFRTNEEEPDVAERGGGELFLEVQLLRHHDLSSARVLLGSAGIGELAVRT